jgi:hypothetical protein
MPKISKDEGEHTLADDLAPHVASIALTTKPVMVCGVNRKVNIGNFETVDVYAGISIPMDVDPTNAEALQAALEDAARLGFAMVSKEASERYWLIKNMTGAREEEVKP